MSWRIAETGFFNSDCTSDIMWKNVNTGGYGIWYMNGFDFTTKAVNLE